MRSRIASPTVMCRFFFFIAAVSSERPSKGRPIHFVESYRRPQNAYPHRRPHTFHFGVLSTSSKCIPVSTSPYILLWSLIDVLKMHTLIDVPIHFTLESYRRPQYAYPYRRPHTFYCGVLSTSSICIPLSTSFTVGLYFYAQPYILLWIVIDVLKIHTLIKIPIDFTVVLYFYS